MGEGTSIQPACESDQRPGITINLLRRKDRLEKELSQVNEALTALQAHPEIQSLLDLLSSIRGL